MNSVNLLMLGKQVRGVFRCFSLMVSFFYLQDQSVYLNNPNIISTDINPIPTWVCIIYQL